MTRTQRLIGVLAVLVMLLASLGSAALAQDQGEQSGTSTQTGGGNVAPPTNNNPDPEPEPQPQPEPEPEPSNPPSSSPQPSNGARSGSQSGTSSSSGLQGPGVSNPEPSNPPSGGTGGGSGRVTIEVNLTRQMIYVYQGGELTGSTAVGTGKDGWETPTGTFYINSKYRYDDMAGDYRNESWYVEDVPYAMYFTGDGHALHGAPWRSSFGTRGSHGCVGMPESFAGWIYSIAPIGTPVYIHY
jgi:lipoprotein-anchoring transpeptidase ErfK/SrfK